MEVIVFDNFAKRKNSTKVPIDSEGTILTVVLKDTCDLVHPSFFISGTNNWCYMKAWDMYYFIDKVSYDINGAQYISCTLDVLATWKSEIENTSAFVKYSSTDYDVNIVDDRVPTKATRSWDYSKKSTLFNTSGCYILSTANQAFGLCHYALSASTVNQLMKKLCDPDGTFVWDKIIEVFSDAMGSIISLRYVPIPASSLDGEDASLDLGDWSESGLTGKLLNRTLYDDNISVDIPWIYSDFRRTSTYTRFYVGLPYIGCVPINAENLIGSSSIMVRLVLDVATGTISYAIYGSAQYTNSHLICTCTGNFGKQIPVAHDQINIMGAVNSAVGIAGGAAATAMNGIEAPLSYGGYGIAPVAVGTMVGSAVKGIIALNTHDFQTIGGYAGASFEYLFYEIWLITVAIDSRIEPSDLATLYGRPCMKVRKIEGLSGYVETVGFNIDIRSTTDVKDLINSYMNGGVYLE